MEEGILEIQPHTHGAFLEPFPDRFNVFHTEINVTNVFIEFLQIQDRSPLVRTPFQFWYSKVWTYILPLYRAHLTNCSFLKKSSHFSIEYILSLKGDSRITRSNPLPRSTILPGRFVTFSDYIDILLTGANFPVAVLRVCDSATQFLG